MLKKVTVILFSVLEILSLFIIYNRSVFNDFGKETTIFLTPFSSSTSLKTVKKDEDYFCLIKYGESIRLNEKYDVSTILATLNGRVIFTEEIPEGKNIYGFSDKIPYKTKIYGKTINIHIFLSDSGYTVLGSPIIFGGY